MTNPSSSDDDWNDLARELGVNKSAPQPPDPALHGPVIKEKRPVVKTFSPAKAAIVYLNKKYNDENKEVQTPQQENGFSFFKDVMADIAPALKYLK